MSSEQPERPEYEARVLGHLRRYLLEGDARIEHRGNRIEIEDVRLERPGAGESSVVILFRESGRPECLFGRREESVGPAEPWQDPYRDAPEGWASQIWISLEEDIMAARYGLPEECDPDGVTWV